MRKILILGSILLILLVILRLTQRSVSGFQNPGSEIIICKASWCGHCKTAMPEFERLVSASPVKLKNGSDVTIRMLDNDTDSAAVKALNVRGFPTILYKSGSGQFQEYPGPRTYDGVMGFLNSM